MAIDNFPLLHASLHHTAGNIPLPKGEPYMYVYEIVFFVEYKTFLFRPRVFSRALCCRRAGEGRLYNTA